MKISKISAIGCIILSINSYAVPGSHGNSNSQGNNPINGAGNSGVIPPGLINNPSTNHTPPPDPHIDDNYTPPPEPPFPSSDVTTSDKSAKPMKPDDLPGSVRVGPQIPDNIKGMPRCAIVNGKCIDKLTKKDLDKMINVPKSATRVIVTKDGIYLK